LPVNWTNIIALPENKKDLAHFLSEELTRNTLNDKVVVIADGFPDEQLVKSNNSDLQQLTARHEKADTRLVLHAIYYDADTIAVLQEIRAS
jgi:hypothetical protein